MRRYVVLSPASSDQVTLLTKTLEDCRKQDLPDCAELCQQFITKEVCCTFGGRQCVCQAAEGTSVVRHVQML